MYEQNYVDLINEIQLNGEQRQGRNGGTKALFGKTLVVPDLMYESFPLLRGRKLFYKGVLGEFAAFLRGPKTLADFERWGCNYWKQWAKPDGSIDVDYGNQWIDFNGTNQLVQLIEGIRTQPHGRRHVVNSWRPDRLNTVDLPCCHFMYQFFITESGHIDMIFYMRSVDVMVGLPSDVILAAVFLLCVCSQTQYKPGIIKMILGDTHIYDVHKPGVEQYLEPFTTMSGKATINRGVIIAYNQAWKMSITDEQDDLFDPSDLTIYYKDEHLPTIKFEVVA